MAGIEACITNTSFMRSGISRLLTTININVGVIKNRPASTAIKSFSNFNFFQSTRAITIPMNSIERGVVILPRYLQVSIMDFGSVIPAKIKNIAIKKPMRGGESMRFSPDSETSEGIGLLLRTAPSIEMPYTPMVQKSVVLAI